ncbi:MAG TPA: ATP-binding protein [Kofleriaceae bacterium]|jgi:signal transduction histidine kinase
MAREGFRRTKSFLLGAFALIAALLAVLELVQWREGMATRDNVETIDDDALVSIELVDRIGMLVDRERILIGRHVLERDPGQMAALEQQIAALRADYAELARTYSPLTTFPGEPYAWHRLGSDVAAEQQQIEPALELSRQNRDVEATQAFAELDPVFERIAHDRIALVDINQAASTHAVANVAELQAHGLALRLVLTAIILVVVLLVGVWLTRAILRSQRDLVTANSTLEVRNRELDAFAGRIAHDLRGPLNTITLGASVLAEGVPQARPTAQMVERSVAQIAALIEDLLALSRIGALPTAVANPAAVAAAIQDELDRIVTTASGTLRLELAPARVTCSESLLRQVLWNLGENAVKYRRADVPPEIEIVGRADETGYAIRVSDNGSGMSADDARHAFEPFYRSPQVRNVAGTGLGLAIVRRIVDANGGDIALESAPGRGTTFEIRLRFAPESEGVAGAIEPAQSVSA